MITLYQFNTTLYSNLSIWINSKPINEPLLQYSLSTWASQITSVLIQYLNILVNNTYEVNVLIECFIYIGVGRVDWLGLLLDLEREQRPIKGWNCPVPTNICKKIHKTPQKMPCKKHLQNAPRKHQPFTRDSVTPLKC